jgi:hypothetical protein
MQLFYQGGTAIPSHGVSYLQMIGPWWLYRRRGAQWLPLMRGISMSSILSAASISEDYIHTTCYANLKALLTYLGMTLCPLAAPS